MITKICSKCKEEKEVCEFNVDNRSKCGRQSSCKLCRKKYNEKNYEKNNINRLKWKTNNPNYSKNYNKQYYINNKEKINDYNKNYYENNKEKLSKINKCYYEENKEVIKSKVKIYRNNNIINVKISEKKYRKNNVEKIKKRKEIFKNTNPSYHNDYLKKRRETDVLFKLISLNRNRINSFLKKNNITKDNKTFDIVGCAPDFLKEYLENQFTEGMSWDNHGLYGWHIDHIIPLSSANTEEEIYKLCHYTNLQPLWAEDNLKKSDKILL
jgi:hypothetical protein